jgi:hypothetical protein
MVGYSVSICIRMDEQLTRECGRLRLSFHWLVVMSDPLKSTEC